MIGRATWGTKRMELAHHRPIMEGRDYGQLKDLISDRSDENRTASEKMCQKPAGNSRRLTKKIWMYY